MAFSLDPDHPDYQVDHGHHRKPVPSRSREHKWTRSNRKNARRKSNSNHTKHAKSGMHRRRNRRMSW